MEVESVINSRHLVYVSDDINADTLITPKHFITHNPDIGLPEIMDHGTEDEKFFTKMSTTKVLLDMWKKGQNHITNFWKIWKNEYLMSLRERKQVHLKQHRIVSHFEPQIDAIVLIKEDLPRGV